MVVESISKAFDTVNHDIWIQKLEHYGIYNTALNWFKSYLTERKEFVSINGINYVTRPITWRPSGICIWTPIVSNLYQ